MESTYLQECILLLIFELVGTEKFEAAFSLFTLETFGVALEELEDVLDDDRLQIDLFLVIQIFGLELDLKQRLAYMLV